MNGIPRKETTLLLLPSLSFSCRSREKKGGNNPVPSAFTFRREGRGDPALAFMAGMAKSQDAVQNQTKEEKKSRAPHLSKRRAITSFHTPPKKEKKEEKKKKCATPTTKLRRPEK